MTNKRFHCKTDKQGITTISAVVVMLLLLSTSCAKENKETVEVAFDPETTFTMKTTDVSTLISDSGVTRYKAEAKEWLVYGKAKEPYSYFAKGIYLEKFDTLFNAELTVKADTAYYYDKKDFWKLIGNVEIKNTEGEIFETSLLHWDQKEGKAYSDRFIRIEQKDQVITGIGFESNLNMTKYTIFNSTGIFPVSETAKDTTNVEEEKASEEIKTGE
jgi:LPS export ABC transporter protein LptC